MNGGDHVGQETEREADFLMTSCYLIVFHVFGLIGEGFGWLSRPLFTHAGMRQVDSSVRFLHLCSKHS